MFEGVHREKTAVILVCFALLILFSYLAGQAYIIFLRPSFGLRYANPFFMISFSIIFFSLVYVYHSWITRIEGEEKDS
ncbi:MAG: hypothetical protein JSW00_13380 [Thermoplasmata archaeon]|nr:MAG: hypothetical protein JSW00_13380 [Thermoplasmata archaeon]